MTAPFASQDWVDALRTRLQQAGDVGAEAATWVYGPIALAVDADQPHGMEETVVRLDVHEGALRAVEAGGAGAVPPAPFRISAPLARWKAVFGGDISLVDGILESKLRVRGDLPTLARHRALLDAIAAAGGAVDTAWQDEQEPASASAG